MSGERWPGPAKVCVAAVESRTSHYLVHALAARRPLAAVLWERRRSPRQTLAFLARRARRRGWVKVADEVLFRIVHAVMHGRRDRQVAGEVLVPRAWQDHPRLGVPELRVASVNSPEAKAFLRRVAPDILLLCGTSIVKPPVLRIASLDTINVHAGITPAYRGVHAPFWALARGELHLIGVTVHRVDEGVDTGTILLQERLERIPAGDSHRALWFRLVPLAARLADEALGLLERGEAHPRDPASTGLPSRLHTHPGLSDYLRARLRRLPGAARRAA